MLFAVRIGNEQVSVGRSIWNNLQPSVRTTLNLRVIPTWVRAVITVIDVRYDISRRVLLNVQRRSVVDGHPKKRIADDDESGMPMKMVESVKLTVAYKPVTVAYKPVTAVFKPVTVVFKPMTVRSLALRYTPLTMHAT